MCPFSTCRPSTNSTRTPGSSSSSTLTTPSSPDAVQRLGDRAADPLVLLGRDRRHVREGVEVLDGACAAQQLGHDELHRVLDAAPQQHRVDAVGQHAHALAQDRLRQQRRRRRAVAGEVGGLGGDLAHELRAHVLELVGELDLAGDRHAVVRDRRRPGEALEHDVAALRAERDLHGVGQLVDACLQPASRIVVEADDLAHRSAPLSGRVGDQDPAPLQASLVEIVHGVVDGVERVGARVHSSRAGLGE